MADQTQNSGWGEVLEGLGADDNQYFIFPKEGRTRVRLLGHGDTPADKFREVQSQFQGRVRSRWILMGFSIPDNAEEAYRLRCVVLSKTAFRSVTTMLHEGYDFFGEGGHGLAILRSDAGGRTNYTVMPSPQPVPIPDEVTAMLKEAKIDDFIPHWIELQNQSANRNQQPQQQMGQQVYPQMQQGQQPPPIGNPLTGNQTNPW